MRYTKEKQSDVLADIRYGMSIPECSGKHGVPTHTIYRWMVNADPYNKELNSRIYKYAPTVVESEAKITTSISDIACLDINEEEWDALCRFVSNELYKLVQDIIEREESYWRQRGAV